MKERRRVTRAPIKTLISEEQSSLISVGTIINISEYGIRYAKQADIKASKNSMISSNLIPSQAQSIDIRKVNFCLPGKTENLELICNVVAEKTNDKLIETSCEFVFISDDRKRAIREYVNKTLL